jgi:hypothetical protein
MSEYRLDITGGVDLSDYTNINDYINLVDGDDILAISLDSVSPEHIGLITRMLESKDFDISSKGGHEGGKYVLFATKRKTLH